MLPSKRSHWYIYDFPFWISSVLPSCNHFVCTSFFVDIYIIMIVFYLESFTHERSYISNWYPLFFHVHHCISFFSFWWLRERICFECVSYFPTSWCTLWPWRLFFLMLVLMRVLPFSISIPPLDKVLTSYLHNGLSQALVLILFISKLVNPFSSMCVWEWYVLHFVSHFIKTMLMSNAHPYLSLLKCFAMTHTHYFGWAYS